MDVEYATPAVQERVSARSWVRSAVAVAVVLLILLLVFAFPGVIHRQRDEVDIRSGRIRHSRYVLLIQTSQAVEATEFSRILASNPSGAAEPDWHVVNTFAGARRVSPHYNFHGAIAQMRGLEMLWRLVPFTDEAKQEVAHSVLKLWQSDRSESAADSYIREVEKLAWQFEGKPGRKVTAADLPASAGVTSATTQH